MRKNTIANLHSRGYKKTEFAANIIRQIAASLEIMGRDGKHQGIMAKVSVRMTFAYPGEIGTRSTVVKR